MIQAVFVYCSKAVKRINVGLKYGNEANIYGEICGSFLAFKLLVRNAIFECCQ